MALRWLSSRLVTLRSALSWTRWRQRSTLRRQQEMREVLLQMAVPLAQALQRQDQLQVQHLQALMGLHRQALEQTLAQLAEIQQLLLEALSPPPEQLTQELLALSRPQPSSPSSAG